MERDLTGGNAVITGSSRGLGIAVARELWRQGANLLLVARDRYALDAAAQSLLRTARRGQTADVLGVDLTAAGAVSEVMAFARSRWKQLDVLVNNAAIVGPIGSTWDTDWENWEQTLSIDLLVPMRLCRESVRWMRDTGGGRIVNISGGGATGPRPNFNAYATAKTALVRFSETLARETVQCGVRVNCVAPGIMNTAMLDAVVQAGPDRVGTEEYDKALAGAQHDDAPAQRAAELIAFLASPASVGITGRLISAAWDPWHQLPAHVAELNATDVYTLRRVLPQDRGLNW